MPSRIRPATTCDSARRRVERPRQPDAADAFLVSLIHTSLSDTQTFYPQKAENPMLAHNVFFSLNDPTDANIQNKYLDGHPGVLFYGCGTLVKDLDRPVNDHGFEVGLHVIFEDRAAHDAYQTASRHLEFIERNKASWKQVRVFDSQD